MGHGMMKALRKTEDGGGHIELCEVPVPEIGPGEVLLKVWAAGVWAVVSGRQERAPSGPPEFPADGRSSTA